MNTKIIKGKLKSVGNIKKITKTMEMVSAAKMKKAVDSALILRPFHEEAQNVLTEISLNSLIHHPLLENNGVDNEVIVLISSNKGLCGSYNTNVYRKILGVNNEKGKTLKVMAFGKYSEKIAKKLDIEVIASFNQPIVNTDDVYVASKMLIDLYKEKRIGGAKVLFTHFTKATSFTPTIIKVLPFLSEGKPDKQGDHRYIYEPNENEVLDTIIPMMIHNILYGTILESLASEHSSRMFAMKNATDNAGEIQKELKLYYNRARQGAVTQEIAEITAGAMALS